jgi:4-hydroxythreonine-4-phosphate dehydrogenase
MWNTGLKNNPPCLLYTPGEPAGIGPDLIIQLAQQPIDLPIIVIGNKKLIEQRAQQLGLLITLRDWQEGVTPNVSTLYIHDIPLPVRCETGKLNVTNASYVLACLQVAARLCLSHPEFALVTGPLHKGIINDAGIPFMGHTEYLAQLSHTPLPVMMLATTGLRVALVTTHLPLAKVAENITQQRVKDVLTILHADLKTKFNLLTPRITVCGLNPHAGESGHLGTEEIDIIIPVLEQLRAQGYQLSGPLPADTAFTPAIMSNTDAFLCMYHDQGLPVLKHVGFGNAINITLGLPFIRTSVDHGTALHLAGTGKADTGSLAAALALASELLQRF